MINSPRRTKCSSTASRRTISCGFDALPLTRWHRTNLAKPTRHCAERRDAIGQATDGSNAATVRWRRSPCPGPPGACSRPARWRRPPASSRSPAPERSCCPRSRLRRRHPTSTMPRHRAPTGGPAAPGGGRPRAERDLHPGRRNGNRASRAHPPRDRRSGRRPGDEQDGLRRPRAHGFGGYGGGGHRLGRRRDRLFDRRPDVQRCHRRRSRGNPVPTLLERARDAGKATGLVTTSQVTDATPAAFGAHVEDRAEQSEIARQYIEYTKVDVILGGGEDWWPRGPRGLGGQPGQRTRRAEQGHRGQSGRARPTSGLPVRHGRRRAGGRTRKGPRAVRQRGDVRARHRGRGRVYDPWCR